MNNANESNNGANTAAEQQLQNNSQQRQNPVASQRAQNLTRRGLNMATGGAWDKLKKAPIVGNAAKKAEDKLANRLGNGRLGKGPHPSNPGGNRLSNPENHQKPDLGVQPPNTKNDPKDPKSGDVGSRNLRKSIVNKATNFLNNRKNKKNKDKKGENKGDNKDNKEEEKKDETSSDDSNSSDDEKENSSPLDEVSDKAKKIKRTILIVKIVSIGMIILVIFSLILSLIMAITGVNIAESIPFMGPGTYGSDSFQSSYKEGTEEYKNEIAYYEKLKQIKKEYDKSHSDELDTSYIHAILLYKYYNEESQEQNAEGEYIPIDYAKMKDEVDTYYDIMKSSSGSKGIDYEINGKLYNSLKNSPEFRVYYKSILLNKRIDELLGEIWTLAEEMGKIEDVDNTTITGETTVSSGNNSSPVSINEYLSDSIYATSTSLSNPEKIKALTIAYSTNIVSENKNLTVNSSGALATNETCSIKNGCSYDSSDKLVSGGGNRSSKNVYFYDGKYYYKKPLTTSEQSELNKTINSVFGNVLVTSSGTYPELSISKLDGYGDGDYKTILKNAYGDYSYKNVGENSYIAEGFFNGVNNILTTVKAYDQKDYPSSRFCGTKGLTIGGSGCGVTAMAMVASTYENNNKYDPLYMNEEARKRGLCGSTGTSQAFFSKEASVLKYKYLGGSKYNKTLLNSVLKHLSQGHLVVVRMGSGHFTSGGHYMVLSGVNPENGKVYVNDPNNKSNKKYRKTGNGWYSFNDIIVKEAYNFYIIWKG